MNVLDIFTGQVDDDIADRDFFRHQYPGWFLMISNRAIVASRSRARAGNNALSTCRSRVSSPFQPAGAFSLTVSGSNLLFVWYNGNDNDSTDKEQQLYVISSGNPTGLELTTAAVGGAQNLTDINGTSVYVEDGAHLTLPNVR